jgi:hypothetical protein
MKGPDEKFRLRVDLNQQIGARSENPVTQQAGNDDRRLQQKKYPRNNAHDVSFVKKFHRSFE